MQGMRGSVFKSVLLNPLVWIGLVLTGFTLHYEGYNRRGGASQEERGGPPQHHRDNGQGY